MPCCGNPTCRHRHKRKLRPLVISILPSSSASPSSDDDVSPPSSSGSRRHEQITRMFTTNPSLRDHFEPPIFSPGVPSREIRNRLKLLEYANQAGLLPELEWQLICKALNEQLSPSANNIASGDEKKKDNDQEVVTQGLSNLELSQECVPGETHKVIDPFVYLATTTRVEPSTSSNCDETNAENTTTSNNNNSNSNKKKVKKNEYETKSLIPISPNRRGSAEDIAVPYSMELWRKSKSLNRDRSVFGCSLAHLIAMKTLIGNNYDKNDDLSSHEAEFDFILEDNVRAFVGLEEEDDNNIMSSSSSCQCASRIWDLIEASNKAQDKPHLRYFGWLGSKPNLTWLYNNHIPRKAFGTGEGNSSRIFPFPTNNDFLLDSIDGSSKSTTRQTTNEDTTEDSSKLPSFSTPGGTAIWGMFAYTISPAAYHSLITQLQNDVGMLMWKGKRMRAFHAKAIDKIIPRTVREIYGERSVHLSDKVAFVRCPMLGSLLHKQWEEGFCESTELQHALSNHEEGCDVWDHVWLEQVERQVVQYRKENGKWIRKEDIQIKSSKSKSNGYARGRSQSPVNITTLALISMLLLLNMLASAFTTSLPNTQRTVTSSMPSSAMKTSTEAVLPNSEERRRAMLGHVPIISRTIHIANDMNVTVWEMESPSEIIQEWWSIDESERTSRVGDPFGVIMWPGSILASRELMKQHKAVSNATVLVLGAGTGVEAQAAAKLGAKKVIATDINPLSLQLLEYGAERIEGIPPDVIHAKNFDLFSSDPLPECDILVAADTLYNADLAKQIGVRLHEAIVRSFEDGHTPTRIIVTDSQKFHGTDFLAEQEMIDLNAIFHDGKWKPLQWELETLKNFCGSGVLIDDDQVYDVDIRVIRWGWDNN
jgi:predicted nicotinamide N-methyase